MKRFASLMRSLHLYTSLTASFAIAFFAVTGLVSELRDDNSEEGSQPTVIAAEILADTAKVSAELRRRFGMSDQIRIEDQTETWLATDRDGADTIEVTVDKVSGNVSTVRWHPLAADAPRDRDGLADWFVHKFGGEIENKDDLVEPDAQILQFVLTSVWWRHAITVDREHQRWSDRFDKSNLASAMTDLHTGEHANWWQRRLMDVTACALLFSTLTGISIGVAWVASRRRRLACLCLAGGCAWLIMLLIDR
jgi:hypothetical protein